MDHRMKGLLLRSLEGPLEERDRLKLDKALAESEDLRRAKAGFEALRRDLAAGASRSFRPGFAGRVLSRLDEAESANGRQALGYDGFRRLFWRFTFAALVVMAVLVTYNLTQAETVTQGDLLYAADQTVGELLKLPVF